MPKQSNEEVWADWYLNLKNHSKTQELSSLFISTPHTDSQHRAKKSFHLLMQINALPHGTSMVKPIFNSGAFSLIL